MLPRLELAEQLGDSKLKLGVMHAHLLNLGLQLQVFASEELDIVLHRLKLEVRLVSRVRLVSELVELVLQLNTVLAQIAYQCSKILHFFGLVISG